MLRRITAGGPFGRWAASRGRRLAVLPVFWLALLVIVSGQASGGEPAAEAPASSEAQPAAPEEASKETGTPVTGGTASPTSEAAPAGPREVTIGVHINDIQELDFRSHSYSVDLYVWLRWKDADLDPEKTLEFMNRYAPNDHVRERFYEEPKKMPDGSLYTGFRTQGRFATKFNLAHYPFDEQRLMIVFEDTESGAGDQVYVADQNPITLNPEVALPGFRLDTPEIRITDKPYATNFGDISDPEPPAYSRVTISVPITRPLIALSSKTLVPIGLIVLCASFVYLVRPSFVDGRIGLAITALLTLVALQLTAGSSLPDVDYLMTIDKVYFASYLFIILTLLRVVTTSWVTAGDARETGIARRDRMLAAGLGLAYVAAVLAFCGWSLAS